MPVSITDCAPQTEADLKSGTTLNQTPPNSGLFHTDPSCTVVNYDAAANEKVYQHGDAFIVFGTDRPSTKASGFGARGSSKAYHIDLVVGRMAGARQGKGAPEGSWVNNSFSADAARVYIGQLTDLDTNFGLAQEGAAFSDNGAKFGRSGVGIKADGVRIVAREGVKIVTGKSDAFRGFGEGGEPNALGGTVEVAPPIELIAGNNTEPREKAIKLWEPPYIETVQTLQPVAMGYNTRDSLRELSKRLDELLGIVWNFMAKQLEYNFINNIDMMASWMPANAAVGATVNLRQIIKAWAPENAIRASLWAWEFNYLFPFSYKFVGSHNVRTT